MQRPEMNSAVESLLKSLTPADTNLNRDQLIYAAGSRAATRRGRRIQRIWQSSTAAALLLSIGLIGLLFAGPGQSNDADTVSSAEDESGPAVSDQSNGSALPPRSSNDVENEGPASVTMSFSSIHNIDGWTREQLKQKGISVTAWKHRSQSEDPPMNWYQISFDRSQIPQSDSCLMTVNFIHDQGVTESAGRVESQPGDTGPLELIFMVDDRYRNSFDDANARSHVTIVMWTDRPDGSRAYGYQLSVKRIVELAGTSES